MNARIEKKIIQLIFISLLIALFMLCPMKFQIIKLAIIIILIINSILNNSLTIIHKILIWTIITVLFNGFSLLHGVIAGNPGWSFYLPTYLLWPILFCFFIGSIKKEYLIGIIKCCYTCTYLIVILGIFSFLKFNIEMNPEGQMLSYHACIRPGFPFIAITSPQITTFIFWFFFFFTLIFIRNRDISWHEKLFILLGIIYIFVTSRRVLFLCFIVAYFLIFFLSADIPYSRHRIKRRINMSVLFIGILIIFSFIILINFGLMEKNSMTEFFQKTSDVSDSERYLQLNSLLDGWIDTPLFGKGTGANASVIRSDIPGTYELTYFAKLFETGFIGFLIYSGLWCFLFFWMIKCVKYNVIPVQYSIATLAAMSIFMICTASNPYLSAFDYMWFMYVPLVIINITDKSLKNGAG